MIFRPSSLRVLYTSLFVLYLVLIAGLSNNPVKAQSATPTPAPTSAEIHPTFGAIQTNTPSILTATPHPTADASGCPSEPLEDRPLDDRWAAFCPVCVSMDSPTITPVAQIPDFQLATPAPSGTGTAAPTGTVAPTYPPMFVLGGTPTTAPTSTAAPTGTPSITATPVLQEVYWDFRAAAHGSTGGVYQYAIRADLWGYCHVADGMVTFPGGYRDADGWHSDSYVFDPGRCSGHAMQVRLPAFDMMVQPNMLDFAIYTDGGLEGLTVSSPGNFDFDPPDDSHTCAYWGLSDRCSGTRYAWSYSNETQIATDLGGLLMDTIDYGAGHAITGVSFAYYGDEFHEDDDSTPTPTPTSAPTALPPPNCAIPEYKDIDTPIAQIDFGVDDIETTCYTILPVVDGSGIGHSELYFEGLEICVHWKRLPTIGFFGIVFGIDLLLIIPVAWLVRRLLTF